MCGLCGVLGPERRAALGELDAMTRALRHRGPDDSGTWTARFGCEGERFAVAFGHTRLAILDLSPAGHQPMRASADDVVVTYNGEIYNFRELREELRAGGHSFGSDCDTEVVLEAYRAWGTRAFERFIGMFAAAIWDARAERLVLVRDRLGIKPLYWSFDGELLLFGSELHALRLHPAFDPTIDRAALGRYLRHGYVPAPETIYRGTRKLAPGEVLVWERGAVRLETFWSLLEPAPEAPPASPTAIVDRLEELVGDAVERRLIADVPLGAFLSGGVDSSVVVALMRERARAPVRTFTIGFREREFDEAPFARAVAAHLKTEHTEWTLERGDVLEVARELPALYDEPFADSSAIPTTLLSRLVRERVTVALSGDGGDELFAGYELHRRFAQLRPWLRLPRALRARASSLRSILPPGRTRNFVRRLGAVDGATLALDLESHFESSALEAALGPEGARPAERFVRAFRDSHAGCDLRRMCFADAASYLADDVLAKVDRASMSVALEVRVPLLDHRVVRFALGLPRSALWRDGVRKAPLRELAYRRIPRALLERRKHGFGIPIHALLGPEIRSWSERYLAPERLREEGLFDPRGIEPLLKAALARKRGVPYALWVLLCFERWYARVHRGEREH